MSFLQRTVLIISTVAFFATTAYLAGRRDGERSILEKQAAVTLTRTTATAGQIIKNEATYDQIFQKIAEDESYGKTDHACPVPRIIRIAIDELPDRSTAN